MEPRRAAKASAAEASYNCNALGLALERDFGELCHVLRKHTDPGSA